MDAAEDRRESENEGREAKGDLPLPLSLFLSKTRESPREFSERGLARERLCAAANWKEGGEVKREGRDTTVGSPLALSKEYEDITGLCVPEDEGDNNRGDKRSYLVASAYVPFCFLRSAEDVSNERSAADDARDKTVWIPRFFFF